jgi:hypothetical protein
MKPKNSAGWTFAAIATVAILRVADIRQGAEMTTLEPDREFQTLRMSGPVARPIPRASFALDFRTPEMAQRMVRNGTLSDTVVEAVTGIGPGPAPDAGAAAKAVVPLQVDAVSAVAVTPKDLERWNRLVSDDWPAYRSLPVAR